MSGFLKFFTDNASIILPAFFGVGWATCEILAHNPKVASNSAFQLIMSFFRKKADK